MGQIPHSTDRVIVIVKLNSKSDKFNCQFYIIMTLPLIQWNLDWWSDMEVFPIDIISISKMWLILQHSYMGSRQSQCKRADTLDVQSRLSVFREQPSSWQVTGYWTESPQDTPHCQQFVHHTTETMHICSMTHQTNKQTTWKRAQAEPASMPLKTKLN